MKRLLLIPLMSLFFFSTAMADSFETYTLDTIIHEKNLLISGVSFRAESFCTDYEMGDQVIFLSGDPGGDCTQASILNLRTNTTCDVWCPTPI